MIPEAENAITNLTAAADRATALFVSYALSVAGALVLVVVGYVAAGFAQRWVGAGLSRIHGFDVTLRHFFAQVVRYAVLALTLVMVLGQFGVQTASIITAIGAVGLAIALALQGTLQNIAAGVMLLVLRPFRIGEEMQAGPIRGVVEDIGLFATTLRTGDGLFILAPNSTLWNQPVTNYSRNGQRRDDITLQIGPRDDIELAQQTLLGLARNDPRVLKDRNVEAFVSALENGAVSLTLRFWTAAADFAGTQADLTKAAKLAFDAKGISPPAGTP